MSVNELAKAYREKGVVLVLGAGLSRGSGLPSWPELLKAIALEVVGRDGQELVRRLRAQDLSAPAIASVLESFDTGRRRNFADLVRDKLYANFKYYGSGVSSRNKAAFIAHVAKTNPTLAGVAAFCAEVNSSGNAYQTNRRVHGIINFNFDALFRHYVFARYGPLVRTVERASKSPVPGRINVYHLHGYLRFDAHRGRGDKEAADKLVLTEQQYFDFTTNQVSLSTYTFLYLLRERPCVFIGLSMQDENLRRLLHRSFSERVQAYAEEGEHGRAEAKSVRHFAMLRNETNPTRRATERSLARLGVRALWIDEYAQIPDLLSEVYETAGLRWDAVYGRNRQATSGANRA